MRIISRSFWSCWPGCFSVEQPAFKTRSLSSTAARLTDQHGQAATKDDGIDEKQIYVLGMGNIGTFVAHGLRSMPRPPNVTLMLHRPEIYQAWNSMGRRVIIQRHGLSEHKLGYGVNFQVEDGVWYRQVPYERSSSSQVPEQQDGDKDIGTVIDESPIEHLVVSTKAIHVSKALASVRHRLTPKSTIVFLQNGMGVIEEVNRIIFPDPETRPSYITGVVSHGLSWFKHFNVIHRGFGTTILGVTHSNPNAEVPPPEDTAEEAPRQETVSATDQPTDEGQSTGPSEIPPLRPVPLAPSASYLLRTFARAGILVPHITNGIDVLLFQLEKLAANALINPLTVLNDCQNGYLLRSESITRVQRLLLYEISSVIAALPELQSVPGIKTRFTPERLLAIAENITRKTARNTSSMLQDVTRGSPTEIEYINGYIVRRGEQVGIACALNYMLMQLVKGKQHVTLTRQLEGIPLDASPGGPGS